MKIISVFIAALALLFVDAAIAAGAIATSVTGTVTVQTGTAAVRPLRTGDSVAQGDTIATAPASSAVLRFDDGEIAAVTANSRLQITAYQFNPTNNSGNVFLSLITGGMRAITGLIGRGSPNNVAYRAATATIGIRGTDVDIVTDGQDKVVVSVNEGSISFNYKGKEYRVDAGQAVFGDNGKVTSDSAQKIFDQLNSQNSTLGAALGSLSALEAAINMTRGSEGSRNETFNSTAGSATGSSTSGTGAGGGGTTVSSH